MNNHIQTAISEQGIEAYLHAQQHKSLLRFSHLRQRGRRQEHPHRPPAARLPADL